MENLSIKLENCYGIGKFEQEFDFSGTNTIVIYAPNGTMKSSFARTFEDFAKDDKREAPKDRVYPDRKTTYKILSDGQQINKGAIFVVNTEDNTFDATDKISSFIARKELKQRYDLIYSELDKSKSEFLIKLKKISQSTDCEAELSSTFSKQGNNTFFTLLLSLLDALSNECEKYTFRYNDIFDKNGKVKKFLEKNQPLLERYFSDYQNILSQSKFFSKSKNSFGTYQANKIVDSIDDNAFFEAGHKFVLSDDTDITSIANLKELIQNEVSAILNDARLRETFDKVDRLIGTNAELRSFKKAIEDNNLLLIELQDYDGFREKVWISYLSQIKNDVFELISLYNQKKAELGKLLEDAKKEIDAWRNITTLFNSRFYVPFTVKIANQEDIVLKQEAAHLVFEYKDSKKEKPVSQEKEALLKILSKGEQRAYYILQLLFDIESRKLSQETNLLIFDDVADSFDYKNKYAIIEYIKDLHESTQFKSIILTHNFDFYRTISSRLSLGSSVYMAVKTEDRQIKLFSGQYRKDVFIKYFIPRLKDPKIFISVIPFVRNIIEYSDGEESDDYKTMTACLHLQYYSREITCNNLLDVFKRKLCKCDRVTIDYGDEKITDFIYEIAKRIIEEHDIDEILLENKIVLSIAIRLKAEELMIKSLSETDLAKIEHNQTRELFNLYKNIETDNNIIRILDKVNLMTPENIHVNAFMYEPLIDMSVWHLINLYKDVCNVSNIGK